jgi:hypothetical protein
VFREICRSPAVAERQAPTRFCEENWHTYRHTAIRSSVADLQELTRLNISSAVRTSAISIAPPMSIPIPASGGANRMPA